jgi:hypothetical protein
MATLPLARVEALEQSHGLGVRSCLLPPPAALALNSRQERLDGQAFDRRGVGVRSCLLQQGRELILPEMS